jgi:Tfp pilus assembly protein PilZ
MACFNSRGETEDISLGGAFIRCEKPLRQNEKVLLTFKDYSSSMRVFAQVAWTNLASEDSRDKPTGMGVHHDLKREKRVHN